MISGETVLSGAKHPGTKLEVLEVNGRFYLGYRDKNGLAYSRETVYFGSPVFAEAILNLIRGYEDFHSKLARELTEKMISNMEKK